MAILTTGQTFSSGDQVTSKKLMDIADLATFSDPAIAARNSSMVTARAYRRNGVVMLTVGRARSAPLFTPRRQPGSVAVSEHAHRFRTKV